MGCNRSVVGSLNGDATNRFYGVWVETQLFVFLPPEATRLLKVWDWLQNFVDTGVEELTLKSNTYIPPLFATAKPPLFAAIVADYAVDGCLVTAHLGIDVSRSERKSDRNQNWRRCKAMHGREGEDRKRRRHMWPVPALGTTTVAVDSIISTADSFFKDGRKISVGDCALFKPPQESPPFIGIIRWLTSGKEDNFLKLGVNWLYRPAEVKLGKGILLEAAPNEVFYSFHRDEIPAASLLHPCKVAFLRKGIELPSGISSFVCRRVYDIASKRLWWLTDQDYINERQEEVDQLLDKTRLEMHATVQPGGRSPKPLNGPASTPQLKPGSDGAQNSATFSCVKGKKKERTDQGSDPVKRERATKTDDGDSGQFRTESMLKSEIAKITEKGGLLDFEGVDKLVQLIKPDRVEKKIDLADRKMLADVIASTDRFDCLGRFVELRGLPVLDEWLQEVHKGKIGHGSNPRESDKSIEEFLLALLRALDKLPVNLHALQTCNIGKSVNNLRSHKNLEIQKKARSLVDTWKKRVEAEMKITDAKSGSSQAVSWPTKPGLSEVSHVGNRRTGGSSEPPVKSSITPSAFKTAPVKLGQGESVFKSTPQLPGSAKSASLPVSVGISSKDLHSKIAVGSGISDLPLTTIGEEKSSSSSQSQNNSQSCSSDHAKTVASSWKEDARSSTAGSLSVNKISSRISRHRKSSNGFVGSAVSGVQKETGSGKCGSLNRNVDSEKVSQSGSGLTCERALDMPVVDHGNSHRLIVRLPNLGRSPARSASGGSFEDPSIMVSRASSPGLSEKHDHYDRKVKGRSDVYRANIASDANTESWQSNDVKDGLAGSDEGDGSPDAVLEEERCRTGEESGKTTEASNATCSSSGNLKSGKSYEASFSSINALIDSCVKHSEACVPLSVGDDVGMNLLASVAAGEMPKSDLVSPIGSPGRNSLVPEDSCMGNDAKLKPSRENIVDRKQGGPDDVADGVPEKQEDIVGTRVKDGFQHLTTHVSANYSGGGCKTTSYFSDVKPVGEHSEHLHSSSMELQRTAELCLKYDGEPETAAGSLAVSLTDTREEGAEGEGANQLCEKRTSGVTGVNGDGGPDFKQKIGSPLFDENKKVDLAGERIVDSVAAVSDFVCGSVGDACDIDNVVSSVKAEKDAVEESPSCPSLEIDGENKNIVHERLSGGISTEQTPPVARLEAMEGSGEDVVLPSGSGNVMGPKNIGTFKAEKADDMEARSHVEQSGKQVMEQASNGPPSLDDRVGAGLGSAFSDHTSEGVEENIERKEVLEHRSSGSDPHEDSSSIPVQETEQCVKSSGSKLTGEEADEKEEYLSTADASSLSVAAGSDMAAKLDFDLNKGFPGDDGNQGEPINSAAPGCSSAVHFPSPLPFPVSSMSSGLPASITVAAAAKGPFVPPENLLKSKAELGWKGSAATSAFRPAEPRKVLEMPLSTTDIPLPANTVGKLVRPALDIDLNVADERNLDDMVAQSSAHLIGSESGPPINNCGMAHGEMFSSPARARSAGGLDLDLNRVDEGTDVGQFSASTSSRLEIPLLSVRSSSFGGLPNSDVNVLRNFDLNNGPGLDEAGTEPAPHNQHAKSSVPFLPPVAGLRMSNTELGNFSSWFPPGNSYSSVTVPPNLPDRGEQPYPILATAGAQRILGPPTAGTNFSPDVYRGAVLSSSPAVGFPPATPFQYSMFPFGSSYPLPSTSFSGGLTTYMDSSSGGVLHFPAVPSQLVGPAGAVSSHYPRPYVISLPDGTSNGGAESSRRWGWQGLDLNEGPGGVDIEGRDERLPLALRQLSVASSPVLSEEQARIYQAAGGMLKRKEPEGGWDAERFSYKHHSWQ
ncbi:hypothetical protein HHK36_024888 [Tetracentron sinense]|uniref:Uncharacterized protein n=1 Tax=Tetracentron sinense TaxID=13715 RepID=A0A835D4I5_TETSI|nr:hypothetical protein HHK36_024888 [Tetracentron sinense]